ncbi:carbohydrate sulfotransferase 1-like [Amphiura filiformis]|uniref:carbohydrate sulfotransferase 1-like n=1 Tax=Amphiura filiformis TaxID=82378 RepID=UPI003B218A8A
MTLPNAKSSTAFAPESGKEERQIPLMMKCRSRRIFVFLTVVISTLTGSVLLYGNVDPSRIDGFLRQDQTNKDTKSNSGILNSISTIPKNMKNASFIATTKLPNKLSAEISEDSIQFPQQEDCSFPVSFTNNKSAILPPSFADDTNGGNFKVIILTRKRSGSSFVGEVLNQNPDMFYVFEPLTVLTFLGVKRFMRKDIFDTFSLQILNATLHCDFQNVYMQNKWWFFLKKNLCLYSNSVKNIEMCGHDPEHDPEPKPKDEQRSYVNKIISNLTRICQNYRYIGIKTIRLTEIRLLKQLMTSSYLNIKILHLVRDPRGTMSSRIKLPQENYEFLRKKGKTGNEVTDLCRSVNRNLKFINNNEDHDWLHNRYKLIRFEDTATNPRKAAEEIYDFLGIPFPDSLSDWIEANTKVNSGDPYSHTRDSKSIVHSWRQYLNLTDVLHMQDKCKNVMPILGYNMVSSTQELRNTSFPVMDSLPLSTISML